MKGTFFYAKLLLFGEYGVIKNSKGLAIPFQPFKGTFKKGTVLEGDIMESNRDLREYCRYLKKLKTDLFSLDLERFERDLKEGMYFYSNIPQAYGIGSSGAIVAATYQKYERKRITVLEDLTKEKLLGLKSIFSLMEFHFHGVSSGLDALNSYLGLPILMQSKTDVHFVGIPHQKNSDSAVFLLDSKTIGKTKSMIAIFMEKMKNEGFRTMLSKDFTTHTDACVDSFLKGDVKRLFKEVKKLSTVVLENFKPMIPENIRSLWKTGIETNDYYLKLCGSGGGGYILGFTMDFKRAKIALSDYDLELVYRF